MHIVPGLEEVLSQLISFTEETTVSVNMYNTVRFTLSKDNSIYCGDVFVATRTHIANENDTFCILRFDVRNKLIKSFLIVLIGLIHSLAVCGIISAHI